MIGRFCAYTTLRNFRPSDAFLILYLMDGVHLSFPAIGGLPAFERVLTGLLEVPLGVATDRWGRRRGLIVCFAALTLAFILFWLAAQQAEPLAWLYAAQALFAVGEAMRSGTHKAIILDWLDRQGRTAEKTRVLAITRFFSKSSAGVAALVGGVLLWTTGRWASLFMVAAGACAAGMLLVWSYPRELDAWDASDGAAAKKPAPPSESLNVPAAGGSSRGPLIALIAASVLFEAHVRLAAQYLQPCLKLALGDVNLQLVGASGAIAVGVYQLVQGLLAGSAAMLGTPLVRRAGSEAAAQTVLVMSALLICAGAGVALWLAAPLLAAALLLLGAAQNARRPVFVAWLDRFMDKRWRATTLSVENQARTWWFSVIVLLAGWLADRVGLVGAFAVVVAGLAVSVALAMRIARRAEPPPAA